MDPEILKCQIYLHPDKPVEVTSQDVKKYLEELGWQEGDLIPSGMPEYTTHVLKVMGKPVTVKSLEDMFKDETVRLTVQNALNKVKLYKNSEDRVDERVKKIIPNPENISEGARDTLLSITREKVKKDIEKEAAVMDVGEGDTDFEGLEDIDTDSDNAEEKDTEPVDEIAVEEEEDNTVVDPKHICPRCGFDINNTYNPFPVTDEDKIRYVYSILGGTDFTKTYKVADGLLEITYKTPTAYVNRLIEDQLKYDNNNHKSINYDQSYVNSIRYGLAASLVSVKSTFGVDTNLPVPKLDEARFVTHGETPLVKFTEFIEDSIIKSGTREVLFRSTYSDFLKLQVRLQYDLKTENFIKAVLDKNS